MGGLKNRDKLVSEICGLVHPCCDDSLMRCSLSSCHYTACPLHHQTTYITKTLHLRTTTVFTTVLQIYASLQRPTIYNSFFFEAAAMLTARYKLCGHVSSRN